MPTVGTIRGWLRGGPDVNALLSGGLGLWPVPDDDHELCVGDALALLAADLIGRLGVLPVAQLPNLVRLAAPALAGIRDPVAEYARVSLRIADRRILVLNNGTDVTPLNIVTGQPAVLGRPIEKIVYDLGALYARKAKDAQSHPADAADNAGR